MNDPRLDYQKLIDETSKAFFPIIIALPGAFFPIGLHFNRLGVTLYLLSAGSFLIAFIGLCWRKKVELLAAHRDAKIEYLKSTDSEFRNAEAFESAYLADLVKKQKYKGFLPSETYDIWFPEHLSKFSFGFFIFILVVTIIYFVVKG
jgi:hypothetical protein